MITKPSQIRPKLLLNPNNDFLAGEQQENISFFMSNTHLTVNHMTYGLQHCWVGLDLYDRHGNQDCHSQLWERKMETTNCQCINQMLL